jgi:protein involved in polysaccharide export with SLBB domain
MDGVMRRFLRCLMTVSTFVPATLQAQASSLNVRSPLGAVTLSPGDVVRITVWRKPEMSGEYVVTADGRIAHPLYREVQVAGAPLAVAEAKVKTLLEKYEANPQFVIEPLLRIAVGGEVRQPNLYTLRPETSVSQAVALAGGPTERGRRDRLRLIRGDREMVIDLRRVDATGAGMPIQSGDQIVVERDRAVFRDLISPVVTVLGATAAVVSVILYSGSGR